MKIFNWALILVCLACGISASAQSLILNPSDYEACYSQVVHDLIGLEKQESKPTGWRRVLGVSSSRLNSSHYSINQDSVAAQIVNEYFRPNAPSTHDWIGFGQPDG